MNNIKIYKFLFLASIFILAGVAILATLSLVDIVPYDGSIGDIYFRLVVLGFVLFIIGLISLRSNQRQLAVSVSQDGVSQKPKQTLATVAMLILSLFIVLAVLGGLIAIALSVSF